jgi:hypothetical protein
MIGVTDGMGPAMAISAGIWAFSGYRLTGLEKGNANSKAP